VNKPDKALVSATLTAIRNCVSQ